ncbi:hypothetical protein C477_11627 [Haloterrigena salina JCM 13891]|uniref:Uncharacterized protein n=1 Tax=Haloterrigena salina JCM 13891 TaxID=1227488 RepID=M0C3S1_9EURY|nr:hypothetical protein C477_11627 [Haloterrigena salina JCM 13891]
MLIDPRKRSSTPETRRRSMCPHLESVERFDPDSRSDHRTASSDHRPIVRPRLYMFDCSSTNTLS